MSTNEVDVQLVAVPIPTDHLLAIAAVVRTTAVVVRFAVWAYDRLAVGDQGRAR